MGFKTRIFPSLEGKEERNRLDLMEDEANAEVQIYLSKDQQWALAMDGDNVPEETCLTKGDKAPPTAPSEDLSDMMGSIRDSKAKNMPQLRFTPSPNNTLGQ